MEGFAEVPDPAPPPLEPGTKEWEIVTEEPAEPTPREARAPIVQQSAGCRAMKPTGQECGNPVGPGGRYCLKHACQGRTASGAPCRNPAMEGSTRCRAHMVE
jgi:hypothetical protein